MTKWLQRFCDNAKPLQKLTFQKKHRLRNGQGAPLAEKVVTIPKAWWLCHRAHCSHWSRIWLCSVWSNWGCGLCFVFCTLYCIETSQVHCPFPSAHWRFNLELIVGDKQTPALRLSTFGTEASIKPSFPHFWFPSVSWFDLAFELLYSRDWFWFWTNMWVRIKLTSYASLAYSTFLRYSVSV